MEVYYFMEWWLNLERETCLVDYVMWAVVLIMQFLIILHG